MSVEKKPDEAGADAKADAPKDAGVNRYIMVTTRFRPELIAKPDLQPLPEVPGGVDEPADKPADEKPAADKSDALRDARPDMPVGLDDRAADAWEPLIAIADAAGGTWPERARRAALELSGEGVREDDSVRVMLLADIRAIFAGREATQMPTADLIEQLIAIEGHLWAEWKGGKPITPTGLARLLAQGLEGK